MSFKRLFAKSLGAAPGRLHMAAHSHHLWPDASFDGQLACWDDAARLSDSKWDRIMGEVWPEAQRHVAAELGTGMSDAVVFACGPWLGTSFPDVVGDAKDVVSENSGTIFANIATLLGLLGAWLSTRRIGRIVNAA